MYISIDHEMKTKTQLRFAFGLLFVVVLSFGGVSLYYMNKIASNSKGVLRDNFESLGYLSKMRKLLDEDPLPLSKVTADHFNVELAKERKNVTEIGEKEAVDRLSQAYETIILPASSIKEQEEALDQARLQIRTIEELNMDAAIRNNTVAQAGIQKAANYLVLAASICFLLLFSLVVNLPDLITRSKKTEEESY